jgi:ABC-type Zn2+ transport system substrate-binding protein/surface adhesin
MSDAHATHADAHADAHAPADDAHGHDDGHGEASEALGGIDWRMWLAGIVGIAAGLAVVLAFVLGTAPV